MEKLISLDQLDCGTCTLCCTSKSFNKYRTPIFKYDEKMNYIVPEYGFDSEVERSSCRSLNAVGCSRYESRPLICRLYPLYPIMINKEIMFGCSTLCARGQRIIKEVFENNESVVSELKYKLHWVKSILKESEIKDFTKRTMSAYGTLTILNLEKRRY